MRSLDNLGNTFFSVLVFGLVNTGCFLTKIIKLFDIAQFISCLGFLHDQLKTKEGKHKVLSKATVPLKQKSLGKLTLRNGPEVPLKYVRRVVYETFLDTRIFY